MQDYIIEAMDILGVEPEDYDIFERDIITLATNLLESNNTR